LFFVLLSRLPPLPTLFPYTTLFRSGGFINSAPDFLDGPKVLNGTSDLMVAAFGDKGRHARTTVGVASLPSDAAVEVDAIFEVSRSEEHTSELQSRVDLVCRLLLEKK